MDVLNPPSTVLIKLGSIIVHYEEWTSKNGHEFDKTTIDSLMSDISVKKWFEQMNDLGLLPVKRK